MNKSPSSPALNCLIACTWYTKERIEVNRILDCFIDAMNCSKTSFVIQSIQAFIICLFNCSDEMKLYIPKIILNLTKKFNYDIYISKIILEFFMRKFTLKKKLKY